MELTTSAADGAGTDADIVLKPYGAGEYLLDYAPYGTPGLAYNDFEAGVTTSYVVGPLDFLPVNITLENRAPGFMDLVKATWDSFTAKLSAWKSRMWDFVEYLVGGPADPVGITHCVWTGTDLINLPPGWQPFSTPRIDGGSRGTYQVHGAIQCRAEGDTAGSPWAEYQIRLDHLECHTESAWDGVSNSDEPFVLAVVRPLGADNYQAWKSRIFRDVDTGDTRRLDKTFTIRLPRGYGMLSLIVEVVEHDLESAADRQALLDDLVREGRAENDQATQGLLDQLAAALRPDWKLRSIEVFAFRRGRAAGKAGTVLRQDVNRWIVGGEQITFPLNRDAPMTSRSNAGLAPNLASGRYPITGVPHRPAPVVARLPDN